MMINIEQQKQTLKLEQMMVILADKNSNEWNKLIEWNIQQNIAFDVRQDIVPDGLKLEYILSELTQFAIISNTDLNVYKYYDLVLLAHSVFD